MNPPLDSIEKALGHSFQNRDLLLQALTHPSWGHEQRRSLPDNQRLEFLGDAVLQLTLTHHLYAAYPQMPEGQLTKIRAALVNRKALASLAQTMDLGPSLVLGRGEERNQGRSRDSNLADAFEAVLGAFYLDAGFEAARLWIEKRLQAQVEEFVLAQNDGNPKGQLQELLQGLSQGTPVYELINSTGPDHAREYTVAVKSTEGKELGSGSGPSKKAAEMNAAAHALLQLKSDEA